MRIDPAKSSEHVKPLYKEGTVTVTVVEAKHLPKMDKHTKCDPYVTLMLGGMAKKTHVVSPPSRDLCDGVHVLSEQCFIVYCLRRI